MGVGLLGGSQDSVTNRVDVITACRLAGGPGTPLPLPPPPPPPRIGRMERAVVTAAATAPPAPPLPAAIRPTEKNNSKINKTSK